jgi:hypothetical protein
VAAFNTPAIDFALSHARPLRVRRDARATSDGLVHCGLVLDGGEVVLVDTSPDLRWIGNVRRSKQQGQRHQGV